MVRKFLVALLMGAGCLQSLPAMVEAGGAGWQSGPALPRSLTDEGVTVGSDGTLYVIGGYGGGTSFLNTVYTYNPATNTGWQAGAQLPHGADGVAVTTGSDGTIYAIGGFDGNQSLKSVYTYQPGPSAQWQAGPPLPQGLDGIAATTGSDGTIYAIGGATYSQYGPDTASSTVYTLKPGPSVTWQTAVPALPQALFDAGAVTAADGTVYVVGGANATSTFATVYSYKPGDTQWKAGPSLPQALLAAGVTMAADGTVYVVGGEDRNLNALNTVYTLQPGLAAAWQTGPALPVNRSFLAAATGSDGTIYAVGGGASYNGISNTVYTLLPSFTTPPTTTASATNADSSVYSPGTWTHQPVTITLTADDHRGPGVAAMYYLPLSGSGACPAPNPGTDGYSVYTNPISVITEGITTVCYYAADKDGNVEQAQSFVVELDQTPPTIFGAPLTPPNTNGWYNGPVSIQWTCSDPPNGSNGTPGSGIAAGACPGNSTISNEGRNETVQAQVRDIAGNVGRGASSPAVNLDLHPPVTTAQLPPIPPSGWFTGPVAVTLNAGDPVLKDGTSGSGVAQTYFSLDGGQPQLYSGQVTVSGNGSHTLSFWSVDAAGNVEDKTQPSNTIHLQIDGTSPICTLTASPSSIWPPNNKLVPVTVTETTNYGPYSGAGSIVLSSISSNEGAINQEESGFVIGQNSTSGYLLASRNGNGVGRVYTLTYTITNKAGTSSTCAVVVTVPHDQGH